MTGTSRMASPRRRPWRGHSSKTLGVRERKELAALAQMPDSAIDTSDIPEVTDWKSAVVGRFYKRAEKAS